MRPKQVRLELQCLFVLFACIFPASREKERLSQLRGGAPAPNPPFPVIPLRDATLFSASARFHGRSLEVEALMGAVLELGRLTDTPAPSIKAVYACVKLLNKIMLLQGAGVRVAAA